MNNDYEKASLPYEEELRKASCNGDTAKIKLLITKGANIHTDNERALRYACYYGHLETVKLLLEHGAVLDDYVLDYIRKYVHIDTVNYIEKWLMKEKIENLCSRK
jgi:ankyrin repeat protein